MKTHIISVLGIKPKWILYILTVILFFGTESYANNGENNQATQLSDSTLTAIRDGYEKRVTDMFNSQRGNALTDMAKVTWNESLAHSYPRTAYAAVQFWFNRNIDSANIALIEYGQYFIDKPDKNRMNVGWHTEMALRLIEMYGSEGTKTPGLLKLETEKKVMEGIWTNVKTAMRKGSEPGNTMTENHTKESKTWYIHSSENLHAQSFITRWNFAKLAKEMIDFKDREYEDGHNASWHYEKWTEYLKMYFEERAKKGIFIEMMSRDYNEKTLKGMFNVYDFSPDSVLKRKAKNYLNLYFTYLGQEQLHGISGGGKSRLYSDIRPSTSWLGYVFFGIGDEPRFETTIIDALTTNYRPPLVVIDIAYDIKGRGDYEVKQRAMGLAEPGYFEPPEYHMRTDSGGIVRYSYCTPEFIIGCNMFQARPFEDWALISSQNQSRGVIFENNPAACILPEVEKIKNRREYNSVWSVQKMGTLICQKLKYNRGAGAMKVWFSEAGLSKPIEEENWVFAKSDYAYAAVKVLGGKYTWKDQTKRAKGKWLMLQNEYSPIIIEVDKKSNYDSFEGFKSKICSNAFSYSDSILKYTGIYGDTFTFFADYSNSPKINDISINYAPDKTYDSPYLESDWNSGIVKIQKGNRLLVLDFN